MLEIENASTNVQLLKLFCLPDAYFTFYNIFAKIPGAGKKTLHITINIAFYVYQVRNTNLITIKSYLQDLLKMLILNIHSYSISVQRLINMH